MIFIDNIYTYNLPNAIHGMRNPFNSWKHSDSKFDMEKDLISIGERDMLLAQRLITSGNDDSKFMRQIFVSMDITAPLYWWKEMDTYKVATTTNSTSTMHKLASTPITRECFSLDEFESLKINENLLIEEYIENTINTLERLRQRYLKTKFPTYWRALVQLLPESWNQTRMWTANYQVLRNIYFARRNHKLKEWQDFCKKIENLPYGKELICYAKGE